MDNSRKRTGAFLLFATLVGACATAPQPAPPEPDVHAQHIERIERGLLPPVVVQGEQPGWTIEARMREYRIQALGIAVFHDYQLQWARAYGLADAESGQRATPDTLYLAGSISKSVNALGVLLAAADGRLALDQPVNELLQSWKLPENELTRATPVTLRQLLSHSAGTTVHGFPGYAAGAEIPTVQQILDGVAPANTPAVRVDLAPGTQFRYSGGGTTITQVALADRSGRPYPDVLAASVLDPLGMRSSSYVQELSPERLRRAAVGYGSDGQAIAGKRHRYPEMAAAGLWTTPADLARFFSEVARARAGQSSKIPQAVAREMTTRVMATGPDPEGDGTGLGVFLTRRNGAWFFGHGGSDAGFQASALASLDGGYGVVIMTNSDNGSRIFPEIERAVLAEYGWAGAEPVHVRVALDPARRPQLPGYYVIAGMETEIAERDGRFYAHVPFAPPAELVPIAPDRLIHSERRTQLRVIADGSIEAHPPGDPPNVVARIPQDRRHPLFELEAGHFDLAASAWRQRIDASPESAAGEERLANDYGYQLMARDPARAVELMRLIAVVFPDSANAQDSLGEAHANAGDKPKAIAAYQRSLELLDADTRLSANGKEALREHAAARLAELRAPE